MSEIKVGDLVMIVRPQPCCGVVGSVGQIFVVTEIKNPERGCVCCGAKTEEMIAKVEGFPWDGFLISRLRRIPPLADLESSTTEALDPADCLAAYETQPKEMTK